MKKSKLKPFNILVAMAGVTSASMAFGENPPGGGHHLYVPNGVISVPAHYLDRSVSRETFDKQGNSFTPKYDCSSQNKLGADSNFTIYEYRAKGSKQTQIMIDGTMNGKAIREIVNGAPDQFNSSFGIFGISEHIRPKQAAALGGIMSYAGMTLSNAQATKVLDAEDGKGNNHDGLLWTKSGSKTPFVCEEQIPYMRLVYDNSSNKKKDSQGKKESTCSLKGEKILVKKYLKSTRTIGKDCHCLVAILRGPSISPELLELQQMLKHQEHMKLKVGFEESETKVFKGHRSMYDFMQALTPEEISKLREAMAKNPDARDVLLKEMMNTPSVRDQLKLIDKMHAGLKGEKMPESEDEFFHSPYEKGSKSAYIERYSDRAMDEYLERSAGNPTEIFKKINEGFELQENIGVKLLNAARSYELSEQLQAIQYGSDDYAAYKQAFSKEPILSEKAFNSIRKVMKRGKQLQERRYEEERFQREMMNPDNLKSAPDSTQKPILPNAQ